MICELQILNKEVINMRGNPKTLMILGIVFLVIGITALVTGAVSRPIAYGDFVLAIVFLMLSRRGGNG